MMRIKEHKQFMKSLVFILPLFFLVACGNGETGDGPAGIVPSAISLSTSLPSVKSDNSNSATVTVSALDASNAAIEGVTISVTADGGSLSAASVVTDANGQAQFQFSSGTVNKSNATRTITASIAGTTVTQSISILVTGTTISASSATSTTSLNTGATDTFTAELLDAGGNPISNSLVSLTTSGTGTVTLSSTSGNTDGFGKISVTVTGGNAGDAVITASAAGATDAFTYTVSAVGAAFEIYSTSVQKDTTSIIALSTSTPLEIFVRDPSNGTVNFVSSLGVFSNLSSYVQNSDATSGTTSETLSSTSTGTAVITVYDTSDTAKMDTMRVAISAPAVDAANIVLQASETTIPVSTTDQTYSTDLTVNVTSLLAQPVGGAAVAFSIVNPTGGGELISPSVAFTDSYGEASVVFTSGSQPSGNDGVTLKAEVIGKAVDSTLDVLIGGEAASVVIGRATLATNYNTSTYKLPMSVVVADSGGNAVSGATVSLRLWPAYYSNYDGTFPNEDTNRDTIEGAGEDKNGDGELTPPNSAAGTIPASVVTDENGVGTFDLIYLKASAIWIAAEIQATVEVLGSETKSTKIFRLPYLDADEPYLPGPSYDSPSGVDMDDINLSGAAGATVSTIISPTFGDLYNFSTNIGTMNPTTDSLTSNFSYTIPGTATSGTTYTAIISIVDSSLPEFLGEYPVTQIVNITVP